MRRLFSFGESERLFDPGKYAQMESKDQKTEYLRRSMDEICSKCENQRLKQKVIQTLHAFSKVLPDLIPTYMLEPNINLFRCLTLLSIHLKGIPKAHKYVMLYQIEVFESEDLFEDVFKVLFDDEEFCNELLNANKLLECYSTAERAIDQSRIPRFLSLFSSDVFIEALRGGNWLMQIEQVFLWILGRNDDSAIKVDLLECFGTFLSKVTFGHPYIVKELVSIRCFVRINKYVIKLEPGQALRFYKAILSEYEMMDTSDALIIKQMNTIYRMPSVTRELQLAILQFLLEHETWLIGLSNASVFKTIDWFLPVVLRDSFMFAVFAGTFARCCYYNREAIRDIADLILIEASPPRQHDVVYVQVFSWYVSCHNMTETHSVVFDANLFFITMVIEQKLEDVYDFFLNFADFRRTIEYALPALERPSEALLRRLVELYNESARHIDLQRFILDLFEKNFSAWTVVFLFENLDEECAQLAITDLLDDHSPEILDYFQDFSLGSSIAEKIHSNKNNAMFVTKVISRITRVTQTRVFDDWIIEFPPESAIFKLEEDFVAKYALPRSQNDTFVIPALIPLCKPVETHVFYNRYLIGAYAIPVYRKLDRQIPPVYMNYAANQYIKYDDFNYYVKRDATVLSNGVNISVSRARLIEVCNCDKLAWITITEGFSFLGFNARFMTVSNNPTPFLVFKTFTLSILDGYIVTHDNQPIEHITTKKWIQFAIFYNRGTSELSIYVDGKEILTVADGMNATFQSIGSSECPPTIHYVISTQGFIKTSKQDLEECLNASFTRKTGASFRTHGSAVTVPHNSFADILTEETGISVVLQQMNNEEGEKFRALVGLIYNYSSYSMIESNDLLAQMRHALIVNSSKCDQRILQIIFKTVFAFHDSKRRSDHLCRFVLDIGFMAGLEENMAKYFITSIQDYMDISPELLDFDFLCEKSFLDVCLMYMRAFKNPEVLQAMTKLIRAVAVRCDVKYLTELAATAPISGIWNLQIGALYSMEKIYELMIFYDRTSPIHPLLVSMILDVEETRGTALLEDKHRLFLALTCEDDLAKRVMKSLIPLCRSDAFVSRNTTVLSRIFRRFANNKDLWKELFVLLFDTAEFEFTTDTKQHVPAVRPNIIPLILSTSLALLKYNDENLSRQVIWSMRFFLARNYKLLISDRIKPALFSFLRRGEIYWSNVIPPLPEGPGWPTNETFGDTLVAFVDKCKNEYDERDIPTDKYIPFAAGFISDVIVSSYVSSPKFLCLLSILKVAHSDVCFAVLEELLERIQEANLTGAILDAIQDIFLHLELHYSDKIDHNHLTDLLFTFCLFDKSVRFAKFTDFWLLALKYVSSAPGIRIIQILKKYMSKMLPKINRYPECFVYILTEMKVPDDDKFVIMLWNELAGERDKDEAYAAFKDSYERWMSEIVRTHRKPTETAPTVPCTLVKFLAPLVYQNAIDAITKYRELVQKINEYYRAAENAYSVSMQAEFIARSQNREFSTTFRLSPFHDNFAVPSTLLRSPFAIDQGNEQEEFILQRNKLFTFQYKLMTPKFETSSFYVTKLFGMSGYLSFGSHRQYFLSTYGSDMKLFNCTLVRLTTMMPSIIGIDSERFVVLAGASLVDDEIVFRDISHENYFMESVLLKEFGTTGLFLGHPVIIVSYSALILCVANHERFLINSLRAGSFVLKFDEEPPNMPKVAPASSLKGAIDSWHANRLSNMELLMTLNLFSGRSFQDLSNYPLVPRVLTSLSGEDFSSDLQTPRDFSTPIAVLCDPDPSHNTLITRYKGQGFHHSENPSNPITVSAMLIRCLPFYSYQQEFHGGFDHIDRMFVSIPTNISLTSMASSELPPQLFSCPEVFENVNNILMPDGNELPMHLPLWSKNTHQFVESHKYALESLHTRQELHKWVDLIFGYKQTGSNAHDSLNTYNPIGYKGARLTRDDKLIRDEWILSCGEMPDQIFNAPFAAYEHMETPKIENIKFEVNTRQVSKKAYLDRENGFAVFDTTRFYDDRFCDALHLHVSVRKMFFAVTLRNSMILVYRMKFENGSAAELTRQSVFIAKSAKFSVVNDQQFICATVCTNEIVLWCFINGTIISVIEVPHVNFLLFDNELNTIFIASDNTISEYTINGKFIRSIQLPSRVTAMSRIFLGYSFNDRMIYAGTRCGTVAIITTDLLTHELKILRQSEASSFPISELFIPRTNSAPVICVIDTSNSKCL